MSNDPSNGEVPGASRPDVPDDFLELLELRLSESVSTRVKGSLFKLYALIGMVVGAILTYAGIDLVDRITEQADRQAEKLIAEKVDPTIREAEAQAEEVKIQLGVIVELNKSARSTIEKLNDQLRDFEPRAQKLQELAAQVESLDLRRKDVEASLTTVDQSISSLSELGKKLSDLATQVNYLSEVVSTLQLSQKTSSDVLSIVNATQTLATVSQQVTQKLSEISDQTRVFFQFYGMTRQAAQDLTQHLRDMGYIVPGEEQVTMSPAGISEIRYFWEQDAARAEELKVAVAKLLNDTAINAKPPTVASKVNWPKEKPRIGTVELWIGLPASAGAE